MANLRKAPRYQIFKGIHFPPTFSPKCLKEAFEYKPEPDDNFIISYPKNGTTWMQNMVISIYRKGQPLEDYRKFRLFSPFIDMVGLEGVFKMPRPGAIKSHLPYIHMPYSPDAKYIFVARNPRDTCVSLYYHTRMYPGYQYHDGLFDDFFELFMKGKVEYNDYFDHLLSWYPHRNDKNVWYTTYEQMKADPKSVICKLAKFLGKEYADAIEKDNAVMSSILKLTSFEFMKAELNEYADDFKNYDQLLSDPDTPEGVKHIIKHLATLDVYKEPPKGEFIRKGIVGDWQNHFSQEQIKRLDAKVIDAIRGTDLNTWWSF